MIRYLKHHQIDKTSWDKAVHNSRNGLVYGESWFLDIVSRGWEALVDGDYDWIMPLPVKQKVFVPYLVQPRFTQQLGVFSGHEIPGDKLKNFICAIPSRFLWKDFNLNYMNQTGFPGQLSERVNYELIMGRSYSEIIKGYNENTRRNLLKAERSGLRIVKPLLPDDFLEHYSLFARIRPDATTYFQLKKIVEYALIHKKGELLLAHDFSGEIIAGAFFLTALQRVIYVASFMLDEGKASAAMFRIMDTMIQKYATRAKVFDFEGSMIPGVARFFRGFGASPLPYLRYRDAVYRKQPLL